MAVVYAVGSRNRDKAAPKDTTAAATAFDRDAKTAFTELVARAPELVDNARKWRDGEKPSEEFAADLQRSLDAFTATRARLAAVRAAPSSALTRALYLHSADLYIETAHTYATATALPPDDLRTQLDLLARRLRELADRIFDRGRVALHLDRSLPAGVEVNEPEEVPSWVAEGLAAGPPLDVTPGPAATTPPLRRASRPEEPLAAWRRDVAAAGVPTTAALQRALDGADAGQLATIARAFLAAAETLRDRPDPAGDRERSARFRLGLLVSADGARAAQAAVLAARPELAAMGPRLVAIGAALRSQQ